ncbi:MAG: FG-GAP-like repeat-containing protein [Gemmatimonadales bacterium]
MKKQCATLAVIVFLSLGGWGGCREKPVDAGALITARTVGLDALQRGRLADAEREFGKVIALAPRDPLGYANLGLTYLREGRYEDAEAQLRQARRHDPANVEVALITAKLYALTNRSADARRMLAELPPDPRVLYALAVLEGPSGEGADRLRQVLDKAPANLAVRLKLADLLLRRGEVDSTVRYLEDVRRLRPAPPRDAMPQFTAALQALRAGRLAEARTALDRFLRIMEVTAPYQAALGDVDWVEGPVPGRPVLAFNPSSLITMRSTARAPESAQLRFTDFSAESGLPDLGVAPTALALGDYDGDGGDNLLLAYVGRDGRLIVQLHAMQGGFVTDVSAKVPLPLPSGAISATFADYDNDGWLDLFAIGSDDHGYLLHNREGQKFEDVTRAAGLADVGGARGALFADLDHDGDLDLLLVGGGAPRVYRNNLDGTFTLFPNADGLTLGGEDAAYGDVDDDGRTDVLIGGHSGSALFHNDAVRGFIRSVDAIDGGGPVAIGDYDNDGELDLFVGGSGLWRNRGGAFTRDTRSPRITAQTAARAVFLDYDNDGWLDLLVAGAHGATLLHNDGTGRLVDRSQVLPADVQRDAIVSLLVADLDGDGDQDIILGDKSGVRMLRNDGGNARLGMQVQLTALGAGSGKNNAFGIGSRLEMRAGELYQTRVVTSRLTLFGLGTHFKADVLRVQWPNGVPQTIYFPGTDQDVLELQQLKGSCAFLYTWDGTRFRFITDIMWRSALGMPLGILGGGNASYAPAGASREYIRIPDDALQPRNGRYVLQVTEELWETAYLDQLHLLMVDHTDSVDVFVDERFPPAGGGLRLYQTMHARPPVSAVDGSGVDVLNDVREHDYRYVSNLTPERYQGITRQHELILDLDERAGLAGTVLLLRGWIYPSDASINIALSQQHRLRAEMPVLEVRDARGRWVKSRDIGFPSGKDKTMVIDLAGMFPTPDHHVRLRTNLQVYWDQVLVAEHGGQETPAAVAATLSPASADLHFRGFSRMYRRGGRYGPHWFDYDSVTTESPWRPIAGMATRFGDVRPLLGAADDQYVVMVPGDEATVEFAVPSLQPPPGWKRTFLLYSDGWIKDSDLNTADGTTIAPLPYHAIMSYPEPPGASYPADSAHQRYLREYNTRGVGRSSTQRR